MRKVSEIKGDEALDVLADLIEPCAEIASDKTIVATLKDGGKAAAIKLAIKNHKESVKTILAILDGEEPANYEISLLALPGRLLDVLNDPELMQLFS